MRKEPILSNKYPYLLYFTTDDKAEIVFEDYNGKEIATHIEYNGKTAQIEKMSWFYIFMLKHFLPIMLFIFVFNAEIFTVIHNWFIPFIELILLLPAFYLFRHKRHLIIFYFFALLCLMYIVATRMSSLISQINYSLTLITYIIYLALLLFDMYMTYKYFIYFYLKNVKQNINYELGSMNFAIGFWKLKKTFYIKKGKTRVANFNLSGIFLKVPKEKLETLVRERKR